MNEEKTNSKSNYSYTHLLPGKRSRHPADPRRTGLLGRASLQQRRLSNSRIIDVLGDFSEQTGASFG